jgi:hypothetical protein
MLGAKMSSARVTIGPVVGVGLLVALVFTAVTIEIEPSSVGWERSSDATASMPDATAEPNETRRDETRRDETRRDDEAGRGRVMRPGT